MKQKIQNILESKYFLLVLFALKQTLLPLAIIAFSLIAIFVFCDDVRNIYGLYIFVPIFMQDLAKETDWTFYIICISLAVCGMIYFLIRKIAFEKVKVQKGKMFWAWVISTVAFCLGGILIHFNILTLLAILGLSILTYLFYFLAVNFTKDLKKHLAYTFIFGAFVSAIAFFILVLRENLGLLEGIASRKVSWVGAQNVNTVAILYTLAIISSFMLGLGKRYDWLYFLVAVFFEGMIYFTYCRLMIFISALIFLFLTILSIVKSKGKMNYLWTTLALLAFAGGMFLLFRKEVIDIITALFVKTQAGGNGRQSLWPWCWNRFEENKAFGYGFVAYEKVPGIRDTIPLVLAHNVALQWLTSLGIVGSLLMLFFYFSKYKLMFTNFKWKRFFDILSILMLAATGFIDQAIIMDPFMFFIPYLYLALIEKESESEIVFDKDLLNRTQIKTN